jgi:hypothetical protein
MKDIDTTVAHPARVYDCWLGGKDNFAADREAAEEVLRARPAILLNVRSNRAFLARTVRYLAGKAVSTTSVAGNGEVIATSETYERKQSALHGIESVKANAPGAEVDDQTDE